MRVSDYVVDQIYKAGCDHIFLVTGGGAMFLNDAVAAHSKIKPICNHHEQASAMGAVAYAKYNNSLAAVNVTTGCGGTNAITGLLDAWQDSVPVIFVSGNVNRPHMAPEGVRNLGVQEANIIDIVKPIPFKIFSLGLKNLTSSSYLPPLAITFLFLPLSPIS